MDSHSTRRPKADWRFMLRHPSHVIALGLGSGLSPWAPGTAGSLLGWWMFSGWMSAAHGPHGWSPTVFAAVLMFAFAIGVLACSTTGRHLGVADHGAMVWDEMVAVWLVLYCTPAGLGWQALAVGLFRLFDIVKPTPIRQTEQRFKGGFGVMIDDILAAGYALLALSLLQWAVRTADGGGAS
jgi:phosphatidylglycerophosphatase A